MGDEIPIEEYQNLVVMLREELEEDYRPHVENIIKDDQVDQQRIQLIRNILTEKKQFSVLKIFEQTLTGKCLLRANVSKYQTNSKIYGNIQKNDFAHTFMFCCILYPHYSLFVKIRFRF